MCTRDPTQAWKHLYSFVILVMIPRTVLRMEESVRSAGPVTTMLRPTPICGTRLKVPATTPPPRINNASNNWQHPAPRGGDYHGGRRSRASSGSVAGGGGGGSRRLAEHPSSSLGTPNTAAATPAAGEEEQHMEWFGTGGRAPPPDAARSGSASSLARTSSGRRRRRKGSSKSGAHRLSDTLPARTGGGVGGERGGRFDILGAPWTGGAGGGGGGHGLVAPYADGEDELFTPGDSPLSTASSVASGLHLSLVGSVATTTGVNSACVSPDGSAMGAAGRGSAQAGGGGQFLGPGFVWPGACKWSRDWSCVSRWR